MAAETKSNDDVDSVKDDWRSRPPYANHIDFKAKYSGKCHCGRVSIECSTDPLDVKICHCTGCQKLQGAPMQIAAIFHKSAIRFTGDSIGHLQFYSSEKEINQHTLPCKLSCKYCYSMIADEGRNMFLAFPSIFDFKDNVVPNAFQPTCHIFYGQRAVDVADDLDKWMGHKNKSKLFGPNAIDIDK